MDHPNVAMDLRVPDNDEYFAAVSQVLTFYFLDNSSHESVEERTTNATQWMKMAMEAVTEEGDFQEASLCILAQVEQFPCHNHISLCCVVENGWCGHIPVSPSAVHGQEWEVDVVEKEVEVWGVFGMQCEVSSGFCW